MIEKDLPYDLQLYTDTPTSRLLAEEVRYQRKCKGKRLIQEYTQKNLRKKGYKNSSKLRY